jgi:hypothetical protein
MMTAMPEPQGRRDERARRHATSGKSTVAGKTLLWIEQHPAFVALMAGGLGIPGAIVSLLDREDLVSVVRVLESPAVIPWWMLLTLSSFAAVGTAFLLHPLVLRLRTPNPTRGHITLTQTVLDGVRWRWRWSVGERAVVASAQPHCTSCDTLLIETTDDSERQVLFCEDCKAARLRLAEDETLDDRRKFVVRRIEAMGRALDEGRPLPA